MLDNKIPRFDLTQAADLARRHYGLEGELLPLPSYRDQNFRLRTVGNGTWVLKLANSVEDRASVESQLAAMVHLKARLEGSALIPEVRLTLEGERIVWTDGKGGVRHLLYLLSYLPGRMVADLESHSTGLIESIGGLVGRVDRGLADFHHAACLDTSMNWDLAQAEKVRSKTQHIKPLRRRLLAEQVLDAHIARVKVGLGHLPGGVLHNDGNCHNVLVEDSGEGPRAVALIDFGDLIKTRRVFGLAIAAAYVVMAKDQPLLAACEMVAGYHRVAPLVQEELAVLLPAIRARLATSVTMAVYHRAQRGSASDDYLTVNVRPGWEALERLAGVDDDLARNLFEEICGLGERRRHVPGRTAEEILAVRHRHFGRNLTTSYQEPLKIVRGHLQYLFDEVGRPYVDGVNNVCHVGHCHPRVVEAAQLQMLLLNTNTRYLHDHLADYTERLAALFPDPLSVVFLVCSGSEANDLALRMARAHTGRHGVVVVDGAYHGHTGCLIDLSPYKNEGPGGIGAPPHVHKVMMPDSYRHPIHDRDREIGGGYAGHMTRALDELDRAGHGIAAFFCESMLGCGGQVELPPGYLKQAFASVRRAGGVCVVDEVQVGFGRVGSHFWAFETQGVVPDIVTLGKPIGNGHPMAAVVTTPEIANSFANGMEYFNTFGGNPVSCAVGMAVLDVIEEEGLQEHARLVGGRLKAGLTSLMEKYPLLGEVRGRGLFLGVELVRDQETLEPAADQATLVVEKMKDRGFLLATDGPLHNVLKIKPPLPFAEENADRLVVELDEVLGELAG
jgi:4-aminobutyrate aminotransferase-like enzyme/Ser/Thr protein kinase RdoA (MazF antagonist)